MPSAISLPMLKFIGVVAEPCRSEMLKCGSLGFDKLVIDTKECKATITVCKDASKNRLKVLWR